LSARYFGAVPRSYVELTPVGDPPSAPDALHAPDGGTTAVEVGDAGSDPVVAAKDRYALHELLGGHRAAFVRNAFSAVLGRDADPEGFGHFDAKLAAGELTRLDALCELRYSKEGRARGTRIAGLGRVRFGRMLRRVPLLGSMLAIAHAVLRLPGIGRRLEWLENNVIELGWETRGTLLRMQRALSEVEWRRANLAGEVDQAIRTLDHSRNLLRDHALMLHGAVGQLQSSDAALRHWMGAFGENLAAIDGMSKRLQSAVQLQATREDLRQALEQVIGALAPLVAIPWELERHKGTLALIEAGAKQALVRVNELEQRHARDMRDLAVGDASGAWAHRPAGLDEFYARFEERFRGTFDDIKSRLAVYVPRVLEVMEAIGPGTALDLGFGRGEWLQLLRDNGIAAGGVDSNGVMVRQVRARGLDVTQGDALEHVRRLPDSSIAVVTAFHVVEHIPFPLIVELLRECARVLKPGGMVLFETPDPENLVVGAHTFWYDPTHVKPLPSEMMRYVAESQGFDRVEVLRLHPNEAWERIPDDAAAPELRDRLNELLYGPRDYSIVGYKPRDTRPAP
jgi:O-antigen chain-terminating methyltransferase